MLSQLALTGGADADEEAVVALAAVLDLLAAEAALAERLETPRPQSGWHAAARVTAQGLPLARLPAPPSWGRIERLRRAGRSGSGVVGQ